MILGIDIGGANTKIATSDGQITEIHYLPLWKNAELTATLESIAARLKPSGVAVVMTGELADCFPSKKSGVQYIKKAVETAFDSSKIRYVNVEGRLTEGKNILSLAAANWCASASLIAEEFEDCILADMGSTTTDLIPIINRRPAAHTTDFLRLLHSELVYTGVLRTSVATLTNHVHIRGRRCRLSTEYFANTADVHLLLGNITPAEYTCETPDGAEPDLPSSKRRLARTLCSDLTEITDKELYKVAEQLYQAQLEHIQEALEDIAHTHKLRHVVACGIGESILKTAAEKAGLNVSLLSNRYEERISQVFPAYAAAKLMEQDR